MTIEILVSRDSSQAELEKAYQTMALAYRTTIVEHVRKSGTCVLELAKEAGCHYPFITERFVNEGTVSTTGIDLDRLIDASFGKKAWIEKMKNIQIHASVMNTQPANYVENEREEDLVRIKLRKDLDLRIREALNKINWFYLESSTRFLEENR